MYLLALILVQVVQAEQALVDRFRERLARPGVERLTLAPEHHPDARGSQWLRVPIAAFRASDRIGSTLALTPMAISTAPGTPGESRT